MVKEEKKMEERQVVFCQGSVIIGLRIKKSFTKRKEIKWQLHVKVQLK